jgi:aminopeptidase N
VGPGRLRKKWQDREGHHFLFKQPAPAQTYLFSFCVAELVESTQDNLTVWARTPGHLLALRKTADAAAFMRGKAGVSAIAAGYVRAFPPQPGLGQEAAGLALLSSGYLDDLERADNVVLMAHELAHQWWGVSVGIRCRSDFWLNEGFAEFLSLAYLEHVHGARAYIERIDKLKAQMDQIRARGGDRPLHFEAWTDVRDALGQVPYLKRALFLYRLREELGENLFWRGIALYTTRHAGQLVESRDFQRAVEEASGRDLSVLFKEVYGK